MHERNLAALQCPCAPCAPGRPRPNRRAMPTPGGGCATPPHHGGARSDGLPRCRCRCASPSRGPPRGCSCSWSPRANRTRATRRPGPSPAGQHGHFGCKHNNWRPSPGCKGAWRTALSPIPPAPEIHWMANRSEAHTPTLSTNSRATPGRLVAMLITGRQANLQRGVHLDMPASRPCQPTSGATAWRGAGMTHACKGIYVTAESGMPVAPCQVACAPLPRCPARPRPSSPARPTRQCAKIG